MKITGSFFYLVIGQILTNILHEILQTANPYKRAQPVYEKVSPSQFFKQQLEKKSVRWLLTFHTDLDQIVFVSVKVNSLSLSLQPYQVCDSNFEVKK